MTTRKKRILFVMQLPPPVHGVSVMNQLVKESTLINGSFACDHINLATARNIDDIQKSRFSKYLLTIIIFLKVLTRLSTKKYDLVYITIFPYGFSFVKDSIMVFLAKLFGVKPMLHLHSSGFKKASGKSAFRRWYYRQNFKNCGVICLSKLLIEDIEGLFEGQVAILPNGIPQVNFENSYKADDKPLHLLYLSNLIRGKGLMILLEALAQVKIKGQDFRLRVVGSERDMDYKTLKELTRELGISNEVILVGPKFETEKHEEFRNAGIFVLPTNYDTFGLVLLEAMQFGVPCISTRVGGIPDVLGDGRGVLIPEISVPELTKAIELMINDRELRLKMSKISFEYYKLNFTIEIFERRLKNILSGNADEIDERLILNAG